MVRVQMKEFRVMARATQPTSDEDPIRLTWQAYQRAFEVPGPAVSLDDSPSAGASKRLKEALAQARDARKFEIEMYWKRAAYFWTFIAAAFVGYASFLTGTHTHAFAAFLMSLIGFVFSLSWYQVNRGSKFWQENWENHVELLEDAITSPLFKVVAKRPKKPWRWSTLGEHIIGPRAVSVSRVNGVVSVFVLIVWLELIFGAAGAIFLRDVRRVSVICPPTKTASAFLGHGGLGNTGIRDCGVASLGCWLSQKGPSSGADFARVSP
jgi:hypothetical protein